MVGRRSPLEIRVDIMRSLVEGADGPTQIMYRANLSWNLLSQHLGALIALGFVEEAQIGRRRRYSLTSRGVETVRSYTDLTRNLIMPIVEQPRAQAPVSGSVQANE